MQDEGCVTKFNEQYQPSRDFIHLSLANFAKEIDNFLLQQVEKLKIKDEENGETVINGYETIQYVYAEPQIKITYETSELPPAQTAAQFYGQIGIEIVKNESEFLIDQPQIFETQVEIDPFAAVTTQEKPCHTEVKAVESAPQPIRRLEADGKRLFHCSQCEKSFKRRKKLTAHVTEEHTNDGLFFCGLCDKTFKRKKYFDVHNKDQHSDNVRLFYCGKCKKEFKKKFDMEKHEKICNNNGECPHCGETYKSVHTLANHMAKKHPNKELPKTDADS